MALILRWDTSFMAATTPRVSVVIASLVGEPFIDDCLASVQQQAAECGAEVVVVACGIGEYADRIARKFPWVRVIHCAERETVPALRRRGVDAASGEIIAIVEEHCVAAPDWLRRAVEAHHGGEFGVVGGPVVDHSYRRLRDWVVYFVEYNGYLPPWRKDEPHDLGSANIAYSRALLMKYRGRRRTCWCTIADLSITATIWDSDIGSAALSPAAARSICRRRRNWPTSSWLRWCPFCFLPGFPNGCWTASARWANSFRPFHW
jgi:glycosyltransferase involved in cell wall biosynthesis